MRKEKVWFLIFYNTALHRQVRPNLPIKFSLLSRIESKISFFNVFPLFFRFELLEKIFSFEKFCMLKLFRLFLVLAFLPSVSFAWNTSCYSPVQMSALLSKPKKSASGVSRSSLRKIEAGISKLEEALDTAEGDLQDSLDKDKLKDKTSTVSGKIRDYIVDGQEGWDCAKGGQSSLFFFPSLIPQAYAHTGDNLPSHDHPHLEDVGADTVGALLGNSEATTSNKGSGEVKTKAGEASSGESRKPIERADTKASSGKTGEENSEQVSSPPVPRVKTAEQKCKERSGYEWKSGQCVKTAEQKCKERSGYEWKSGQCVKTAEQKCKERSGYEWKSGQCVKTAEQKCKERSGYEWKSGQCVKTAEQKCKERSGYEWKSGQCVKTAEQKCKERSGYEWKSGQCVKTAEQKCKERSGYEWKSGQCVKTAEQKCKERSGYEWKSGQCVKTAEQKCKERSGYEWKSGQCVKTAEQKCKERSGYEWKSGQCVKTAEQKCKERSGYEWKSGQCVKTAEQKCKDKPGNWRFFGRRCICSLPNKIDGDNCRSRTEAEKNEEACKRGGGNWNGSSCDCPRAKPKWSDNKKCEACPTDKPLFSGGQCVKTAEQKCDDKGDKWLFVDDHRGPRCICPSPYKKEGNNCRAKTEAEKNEEACKRKGSGWVWKNGKCVECPEWKKHPAFKSNGRVSSSFCDKYAKEERDCKRALSRLQKYAKQLNRLRDRRDSLEEKLLSSQLNPKEESTTEASGLCFDCLKRVIKSSRPSMGQTVGQSLGLLAGAGLSIAGYNIGKNAQTQANMLRIQQGYPSINDGFSLTGMGMGYPFMANSLYGMTRANTPVGGWACSPTVSPYGHVYNSGYGYGHNMRYY